MDVTTTIGNDELETVLSELYPARVTVTTQAETYERYCDWVEGEPEYPNSWDDLAEKFADLTIALDDGTHTAVLKRVRHYESHTGRELVEPFRT